MMITKFKPAYDYNPRHSQPRKLCAYKFGLLVVHRMGMHFGAPPIWGISHRATGKALGVNAYRARHLLDIARALSVDPVWSDPLADTDWAIYITKRAVHHHGGGKVFTVGRVSQ